MKKLRLNLEDLKVESFETATAPSGTRGTVQGHVTEQECESLMTCWVSIDPTCQSGGTDPNTEDPYEPAFTCFIPICQTYDTSPTCDQFCPQ